MSATKVDLPAAGKSTASSRRIWVIIAMAVAVVALGVGTYTAWNWRQRVQIVEAAIPARPDLSRFPAELATRVASAETRARQGGSVAALADLASLYHANGFYNEAAVCESALMRVDPRNGKWSHWLASVQAGYGELDTAIVLWKRTLRLAPTYLPVAIRLGDAYLKGNRDADATAAYQHVLQLDPNNPYAMVGLARIELKAGHPEQARERLEKAAEQTKSAIGTDLLVTVYEQLGQKDRADALRGRMKSAGTYYDPPDPWLDDLMLNDCYDPFRLSLGAGFAEHRGDPDTGRRILERATDLAPKDGNLWLQLGMMCHNMGDGAFARRYFEKAAAVDPTLSDAWAQLIVIYAEQGETALAARALAAGLRNCPTSPGLHLEYARRLAAAGQDDAAIAEFRETLRLRPDEGDPLIGVAQIYLKQGRTKEAAAELKHALEVEPGHPLALMTLSMYSIQYGTETEAHDWMRQTELQVRVPPAALAHLKDAFAQRFGHPYVP